MDHQSVVGLLKEAGTSVCLVVSREVIPVTDNEVQRLSLSLSLSLCLSVSLAVSAIYCVEYLSCVQQLLNLSDCLRTSAPLFLFM